MTAVGGVVGWVLVAMFAAVLGPAALFVIVPLGIWYVVCICTGRR